MNAMRLDDTLLPQLSKAFKARVLYKDTTKLARELD